MHAMLMFAALVCIGILALLSWILSTSGKSSTKTRPQSDSESSPPGSRKRYIDVATHREERLRPHIDKWLAQPRSLEVRQRLEEQLKELLSLHFSRGVALSTSLKQFTTELRKWGTGEIFEQYLGLFRELPHVERERLVTGIYRNDIAIEFVAIPICLGRTELAREYASIAMPHLTGVAYVNEMGSALMALIESRPYQRATLESPTGIFKHWVLYLDLVEAITNGRSFQKEVEAVEASFKRLSTNKRNKEYSFLDPSGYHELDWDCRLAYRLEAAHQCGWVPHRHDA